MFVGYCKILSFSPFCLSLFKISKSALICLTKCTGTTLLLKPKFSVVSVKVKKILKQLQKKQQCHYLLEIVTRLYSTRIILFYVFSCIINFIILVITYNESLIKKIVMLLTKNNNRKEQFVYVFQKFFNHSFYLKTWKRGKEIKE